MTRSRRCRRWREYAPVIVFEQRTGADAAPAVLTPEGSLRLWRDGARLPSCYPRLRE